MDTIWIYPMTSSKKLWVYCGHNTGISNGEKTKLRF